MELKGTEGGATERPSKSFWRCERGAAMTEGVIVLPFFIIIFAGTLYMFAGHRKKSAMRAQARELVMDRVTQGCAGGSPDETLLDGLDEGDFNFRARANVPVLGQSYIETILEESKVAMGQGFVERPGVYGGGPQSVRAGYAAECNEIARDTEADNWNAVLDTFCRFAGCP